jgi:transcriptional regulator with XRE-family HTH domain
MPLEGLRAVRELTQEQLAKALGVNQAAVSKLERRADMYVTTLRKYIESQKWDDDDQGFKITAPTEP